jgi:hypothetical protein
MKIYAPVKDTNGVHASILFVNGVGQTDNPALIQWFKRHGYRVEDEPMVTSGYVSVIEDVPVEVPESVTTVTSTELDFESMTPNELRDWAKANGLGSVIKNTRNKEKLLELIRG